MVTYNSFKLICNFQVFDESYSSSSLVFFRSTGNKAYSLKLASSLELDVYCHMTHDLGACGGGGWTLVMKIDGNEVNKLLLLFILRFSKN